MELYLHQNGKQIGPYTKDQISSMLSDGKLSRDAIVWHEGLEEWQPLHSVLKLPPPAPVRGQPPTAEGKKGVVGGVVDRISDASGLERLEGFSAKRLFSEVFQKHSPTEIEEHFASGTRATTPPLESVPTIWPTPWAFFRVLALSVLASIGFYWAIGRFENPKLIPGWIFVGCFGIPFAVLVFFIEANVLRNVSSYRIFSLLVMGGILSLIISLFLFELTDLDEWIGAMSAGVIEEVGKLLAVVFFTRKWKEFHWILNGILFGAAIGAGFSAFESAGYVFVSIATGESFEAETTMTLRAFLSPFTHVIWTAAAAGALWRVKQHRSFEFSMLFDWRFLRVFLIVVALHALWNSPLTLPVVGDMSGYLALRLVFGLVGWLIILLLVQAVFERSRSHRRNNQANKASLLTPDPPQVHVIMSIPPLTRDRGRAHGQA